jgi:hypothetical protein
MNCRNEAGKVYSDRNPKGLEKEGMFIAVEASQKAGIKLGSLC